MYLDGSCKHSWFIVQSNTDSLKSFTALKQIRDPAQVWEGQATLHNWREWKNKEQTVVHLQQLLADPQKHLGWTPKSRGAHSSARGLHRYYPALLHSDLSHNIPNKNCFLFCSSTGKTETQLWGTDWSPGSQQQSPAHKSGLKSWSMVLRTSTALEKAIIVSY